MSPGTETQILMPDAHKACVWWIWTAIELQVKQKSVLVWFVSNVVMSDPLGLIASLESESSCVNFFRRQDVLQMRNEFTFHCTKNPAAHRSSIRTHLPLLFWSFPPSWDSSWSTSWWKSPSLLFHFHPFFLLKRQEDSLSSLKAYWLELWLFFRVAALLLYIFIFLSFLFLFFSQYIQSLSS